MCADKPNKKVLVLKIILTINRQVLPLILKTNNPFPTASTELKSFLISLNPCQSAFKVMIYQRSNGSNNSGCSITNFLIALCDIITIFVKVSNISKNEIIF